MSTKPAVYTPADVALKARCKLLVREIGRIGDKLKVLDYTAVADARKKQRAAGHTPLESVAEMMKEAESIIYQLDADTICDNFITHTFAHWALMGRPSKDTTTMCARAVCNLLDLENYGSDYKVIVESVFGTERPAKPDEKSQFPIIANRVYTPVEVPIPDEDIKRLAVLLLELVKYAVLYIHEARAPMEQSNGGMAYSRNVHPEIVLRHWCQTCVPPFELPSPDVIASSKKRQRE